MTYSTMVIGRHFKVNGPDCEFFGTKARSFDTGHLGVSLLGIAYSVIEHDDVLAAYRTAVAEDIQAGNGDKIAKLILPPYGAMVLYHVQYVTPVHLKMADEGPSSIDIPNVNIDDRNLLVRIVDNPRQPVVTADADGNIL